MKNLLLVFILILTLTTTVSAEQSTDSTGDYYMDLGQVYGAAKSIEYYKDICVTAFPHLREKSERAYAAWRKGRLAFLQELQKHRTVIAWKESGGNPTQHTAVLQQMEASIERYKPVLENELRSGGDEQFKLKCILFPKYLNTDPGNLEFFYAEQVATIRRGPK